jgi:aminopeptidase
VLSVREEIVERLADLAVSFGANVQPGQIVCVQTEVTRAPVARVVAEKAYAAGAKYVDVTYHDAFARRARIEHGVDESIGYAAPWQLDRVREMGEQRVALIQLDGGLDPAATRGLDPIRIAKDQSPVRREYIKLVNERVLNWTIVACPSAEWAREVHPGVPEDEALERLWAQVTHMCRLDQVDPVAAWRERMDRLSVVAERLTAQRFDRLHFQGPGTDLTIGLLPSSRWMAASFETAEGIPHFPNLPSEEIFTTPDPERVDGTVRSTKPLDIEGTLVEGLRVRFEGGRAVQIDADTGVELLRARAARDEGAARLGEVALVDGEGRVGAQDTVFLTTLIDENAASHVALGNAYSFVVDDEADRRRANDSSIHVDFMIGSAEVSVDGITGEDRRVPVLHRGEWQL